MCKPPVPTTVHYNESLSSLLFLGPPLNQLSYVCVTRKPAWDPKKRYYRSNADSSYTPQQSSGGSRQPCSFLRGYRFEFTLTCVFMYCRGHVFSAWWWSFPQRIVRTTSGAWLRSVVGSHVTCIMLFMLTMVVILAYIFIES